jgi:hypothetical protein
LRLTATQLVLLTLCLANTPDRVGWYAERVPFLAFLGHADNEMAEYGHLHSLPEVGTFKSRWELDRLKDEDRRRGRDVVAIINQYPDENYRKFVTEHLAFRDPLLYESRIHIFGRDFHLRQARRDTTEQYTQREHLTIAYREHLILNKFFPTTLGASAFVLPPSTVAHLEMEQNPEQEFISKAGSHLITRFSEVALRSILLSLVVFLVIIDVVLGIRERRRSEEAIP